MCTWPPCTGHSLGAALSLVFAQVLHCRHPELAERVAGVYAFACPRVGDAAFAAAISAAFSRPERRLLNRIAYGADIIPHLPPRVLEYEDVGDEVFLTSTGRVITGQKVALSAW
jgi:predicted lipase